MGHVVVGDLAEADEFCVVVALARHSHHGCIADPPGPQSLEQRIRRVPDLDHLVTSEGHPLPLKASEYLRQW